MKELERILKALANRRRLAIVLHIREVKEAKVGDIAEKIKLSFPSTSRHLAILYAADIVEKEQKSLEMYYRLSSSMSSVAKYISNLVK